MDLSYDEVQHLAEADRREVDPPIEVYAVTWSHAGQLDWWVKERQEWLGRVRSPHHTNIQVGSYQPGACTGRVFARTQRPCPDDSYHKH
jgi:hypothetical protein